MYYGISQISFEGDERTRDDARLLSSLVDGLRKRFKICVRISPAFQKSGSLEIVVALLGVNEQDINQQLDAVTAYCEDFGLGRIAAEKALVDGIDFEQQA